MVLPRMLTQLANELNDTLSLAIAYPLITL
jgi:hypothetical protein